MRPAKQQQRGALYGSVERGESLRQRELDEHRPVERRDARVRGQHFLALDVARDGLIFAGPGGKGRDLRQLREIGLLEDQADVGVRDQRAGGVDDVGEARFPDLDARDDLPHELEVDLRDGDTAGGAARGPGDRHVRLGLLAEVHRAVPGLAAPRLRELGVLREVGVAADDVHREARHAQLLAARLIEPRDLGDGGRLAQELQVLVAPLLDDVAPGGDLRQRRPPELVLDVVDVLLDAGGGGDRLLALKRDEVVLVLQPGEIEADAPAREQRRGHQDDDERCVLREQAPAGGHCVTSSACARLSTCRIP